MMKRMKYLGIDYGSKRVGLAISNSEGSMATPLSVIENKDLDQHILKICADHSIDQVVIGESVDLLGVKNPIAKHAEAFATRLDNDHGLKIHFHTEVMTSMQSKWGTEKQVRRSGKDKEKKSVGRKHVDDIAASIMLQNFLDRQN